MRLNNRAIISLLLYLTIIFTAGLSSLTIAPVTAGAASAHIPIAGGIQSGYALKTDGTVYAWGWNGYGQLGNNSTADSNVPVQVSGLTGVMAIAGESYCGYALKSDGTVWAWGWNKYGQLGNNSTTDSHVPVQVSGLTGVVAIAGGWYCGYALKSDGTVWAWGRNDFGQLGNNSTTSSSVPVKVSNLTDVVAIAGGGYSGYALKSDGTVWAWGYNGSGQLGNNSTTISYVPVQVSGLTGVVSIAGGYYSGYALKSDGTVWAWGCNEYGQLGNNSTTDSHVPVQVSNLTGVTAIKGGVYSGYALKSDGTVHAWGYNAYGQLGDNSNIDRHAPVQVSGLTGVTAIAGGGYSGYAFKPDGTVWAWGYNGYGQLGNNSYLGSYVPVKVFNLVAGVPPGPASRLVWQTQPGGASSGTNLSPQPVLCLEDADGNIEIGDNSSMVTVALTNPDGAILGGVATVTVNAGVATFSDLNVDKAGCYTLTATCGSITSPASDCFSITAGPPDHITLSLSASSLPADGASQATVTATVYDACNNPVPGVPVTFSCDLGAMDIPDTVTTDSNGLATDIFTSPNNTGTAKVIATSGTAAGTAFITLTPVPAALSITSTNLPAGVVGTPYIAALAATGGIAPYSWSATGLPDGLNMGGNGIITGTPTAAGTFSVVASVYDSASRTATMDLILMVNPADSSQLSNNTDLSILLISRGTLTPVFQPDITGYTADVANNADSISVTAAVYDSCSTLQINDRPVSNGGSMTVFLNTGSNIVTIKVTAQDGTFKIYTVTITRAALHTGSPENNSITVCIEPFIVTSLLGGDVKLTADIYTLDGRQLNTSEIQVDPNGQFKLSSMSLRNISFYFRESFITKTFSIKNVVLNNIFIKTESIKKFLLLPVHLGQHCHLSRF